MSGQAQDSEARLVIGPGIFSGSSGPFQLEFWYHMFGEGIGSLVVTAFDGDTEVEVFIQTGAGMCINMKIS